MTDFNWMTYCVLVGMGILGAILVMPYAFEINKDKLAEAPLSTGQLAMLSIIQGMIVFAVITFVGLLATNAVGLSIVSDMAMLPMAIVLGILASTVLIGLEYIIFRPRMPEALRQGEAHIALWKRFAASFYGGVSEEILTRLFLMSGIAWLLGRIWQTPTGLPTDGAFIVAIIVASILFGLGHLPATAAMTKLTSLIVIRAIVLNSILGLLCGWLFWQYGLVAAMIAHFSGDIILHVIIPLILRPSSTPHPSSATQAI